MTNSEQQGPSPSSRRPGAEGGGRMDGKKDADRAPLNLTIARVALGVVIGAALGTLAVYGMNGLSGNAPAPQTSHSSSSATPSSTPAATAASPAPTAADAACPDAAGRARALEPFAKGDLAALKITTTPKLLPNLSFVDAEGRALTLADFRGRVLLVNLWATWCVPCRKEMPELDHLEAALGGPEFEVVAINLDTRDPDKPRAFLRDIGVSRLNNYADPKGESFQALRSVGRGFGLPTTLLVDRDGCELGFLAGPAAWGGADAQALVKAALSPDAARPERN